MAHILGGFSEPQTATEEIQKICDHVKAQVEEITKKTYGGFRAVKYSNQIVTGTNYIIQVCVGGCSHIYLKVYQSLHGDIVLNSVQENKDDLPVPF